MMNKKITTRKNIAFESMCKEAYGRPVLTIDQELELANRFRNGDMEALQKLYDFNLRFVLAAAKQYLDKGKTLEELIEAGKYGIELAAVKYNRQCGVTFISYMVLLILKCIQRLFETKETIKK